MRKFVRACVCACVRVCVLRSFTSVNSGVLNLSLATLYEVSAAVSPHHYKYNSQLLTTVCRQSFKVVQESLDLLQQRRVFVRPGVFTVGILFVENTENARNVHE